MNQHTRHHHRRGNGGTFDPQQAAALLDQTSQKARRKLAPSPPWLLATRAVAVLAALGAIWLSVRGQHPYKGPTWPRTSRSLVAFVVVNFGAHGRGPRARARRRTRRNPAAARPRSPSWWLAWAVVPVFMGALAANGVSFSSGYPTTVLIIVAGLVWADRGGPGGLAQVPAPGSRSPPSASWVRSPGRPGLGGRRRGPVRRAHGRGRRHRLAAAPQRGHGHDRPRSSTR